MTPQPGVFAIGTRAHHHLEYDGVRDLDAALAAIARVRDAATTVAGVNVVVGIRPSLWGRAAADAADFATLEGADGFSFDATQHDLWLWLHGAGPDSLLDIALLAHFELRACATLAAEQVSFTYQSSLDLTGFEDGTENPPLDEAIGAATIAADQPGGGGSVVLVQRWVHDLGGFTAMSPDEQEAVIGRTLVGSRELDPSVMPSDAHVARVVIEDDAGEELEIFRRSTAFGGVAEHGLMFVGFAADQARLLAMLRRMAGADDGVRDRLTRYSTPTSSAIYVVPSVTELR